MNFQPLLDRVVIKRAGNEDTITESGILLPSHLKETPSEGTVVAVGPKVKSVKTGDRVLIGKYIGVEITVDDKKLILMREEEVLGKFTDKKAGE
jgi:chaperonin GroES